MKKTITLCLSLILATSRLFAQWSELGGKDSLSANYWIRSICSDESGNIYAAGFFTNSAGKFYVAKWNKTTNTWGELGRAGALAASGLIYSICSDGSGNIYAAGAFTNSSGKSYVAVWDKDSNYWSELGGADALAANSWISSICSDESGNIYAAGMFTNSSGKKYVAKWDKATNTWSELGGTGALAANNEVISICGDGSKIYAGGRFTNSWGENYVAKWNGNTWNELGGMGALAANDEIYSIYSDGLGKIYAAGNFRNNSGSTYVAVWDKNSNTWSELGGMDDLAANGLISSICSDGSGNIYVGGLFTNSSGKNYVAKWNKATNTWSELGGLNALAANNYTLSTCSDGSGNIYVGGAFTNDSGKYYVAKWQNQPPVGVNEVKPGTQQALLYPNPAAQQVSIDFGQEFTGKLKLIDVCGKMITEHDLNHAINHTLNLDQLRTGIYFVQLAPEHGSTRVLKLQVVK